MRTTRTKLGLGGMVVVLVALGALVASAAFAAGHAGVKKGAASATLITVVTGKPIEYSLQLSRMNLRPGPVVFTVQNQGLQRYIFQICPRGGNADVCDGGASTKTLLPGQSAKLTTTLKKGLHEFILRTDDYVTTKGTLEATPSAAVGKTTTAPGTKPAKGSKKPSTTTPTTTTPGKAAPSKPGSPSPGSPSPAGPAAAPPGGATLIGNPASGATVFRSAGCGGCHTLAAAGTNGTAGPNLDQVAPDQQTVVTNVTFGNAMGMPAFGGPGGSLSAQQINDVAAYVYSSTHSTAH